MLQEEAAAALGDHRAVEIQVFEEMVRCAGVVIVETIVIDHTKNKKENKNKNQYNYKHKQTNIQFIHFNLMTIEKNTFLY